MNSRNFEKGMALLAALAILVGVSAAATTALAGDFGTVEIHGTTQI